MRALILLIALLSTGVALAKDAGVASPRNQDAGASATAQPQAPLGPPPAVKLECEPNPARMGERVTCAVTIIHRREVTVKATAPIEVRAIEATPAEPHMTDMLKTVRRFQLQPRSMKKLRVEGLKVIWTESNGGIGEVEVPAQKIPIRSLMTGVQSPVAKTFEEPGDDPEAYWERHGPIPYLVTNWPLIIGLFSLLVIAIGILLGIWIKRLMDERTSDDITGVLPHEAHLIALSEIKNLNAENLPQRGLSEDYLVKLSEIVRRYLKHRYQIQGLEWTSEELRRWAESTELSASAQEKLAAFLLETDLVKFANVQATEAAVEPTLVCAMEFIELTQLTEVQEEPGSAVSGGPTNRVDQTDTTPERSDLDVAPESEGVTASPAPTEETGIASPQSREDDS